MHEIQLIINIKIKNLHQFLYSAHQYVIVEFQHLCVKVYFKLSTIVFITNVRLLPMTSNWAAVSRIKFTDHKIKQSQVCTFYPKNFAVLIYCIHSN